MTNLFKYSKESSGQTIVMVLLYVIIISMLVTSIVILTQNNSKIQTNESNYSNAKLLARSKIEQILGADDDLFINNSNLVNKYFDKIKGTQSSETIITNTNFSKSVDGLESLGQIEFQNSGSDQNSKVTCTKTASSEINRFYLPQYKSISIKPTNQSLMSVGFMNTDSLSFSIFYKTTDNKFGNFEFGISTTNSGSSGNIIMKDGLVNYPVIKNKFPDLSKFVFSGSSNSSLDTSGQQVASVDFSSLINELNNTGFLQPGISIQNMEALEITNISDLESNAELTVWGSQLTATTVKLSCKADIAYFEPTGTIASYDLSVYYPTNIITPNFMNYAIAIGKYADNSGNENYVLAK